MFNIIFSFFFNHTLLQVFSCILGVLCFICYWFGIRYIFAYKSGSGKHWFISYVLCSIWLIVCIITWVVEIVLTVKRDESPSIWIWNACIGVFAFIISLSIALFKPEPTPSLHLYDSELEENESDEDVLGVSEEDEDDFLDEEDNVFYMDLPSPPYAPAPPPVALPFLPPIPPHIPEPPHFEL